MIVVRYRQPADFLQAYSGASGHLGGLFVAVTPEVQVGEETPVEFRFGDGKVFRTQCRVAWRRLVGTDALPAGLGLQFLTRERQTRDLLLAYADGKDIQYAPRSSGRVPAEIAVRVRFDHGELQEHSRDISNDGIFVSTNLALQIGSKVQITLKRPGRLLGLSLAAQVARQEPTGLGFRFVFRTDRSRRQVESLVREMREKAGPQATLVAPIPQD